MNLLPGIEPSAKDLINEALGLPLEQKIKKAIWLLKAMEPAALNLSPEGFHVCDSFGKDSDCIVQLAKMAGVAHQCWHNVTSIDPPELMRFGLRNRQDTRLIRPRVSLLTRMIEKNNGPPTRLSRWCCEQYKEHGGDGKAKVIGVRISESQRRADIWSSVVNNRKSGVIVCPIVYWTDADVWEFHRLYNLPYCELYDQGFSRLGCVGCPLAGPNAQKMEFARWPRYERNWKRAFDRFWQKWHGVPLDCPSARYFDATGKPVKDAKQKQFAPEVWLAINDCEPEHWIFTVDRLGRDVRAGMSLLRWFERFDDWRDMWSWWISGGAYEGASDCQMEFLFT